MRMRTGWAVGFVMLAVFAVGAAAQISLRSAVGLALHNDPRIKAAAANVDKARAVLSAAHDVYIPSASASGGYGTSTGVPLDVPVVFSLASQSLLFNFSQKDNVRAALSGLEAAKLELQESSAIVSEDVVVTYLSLSNAQQRKSAMDQEFSIANRLVTIVKDRLKAGQDSRVELLRAQRSAKQIELQQLQTDDEIATLSDHLERLVGLPGRTIAAIPDSIPALPPLSYFNDNGPASFGIRAAVASARSKQEMAFGEARYRFRPQASFFANYSRISTAHTNYLDYYPGFLQKSEDAASIGIQILIPLLDRGHEAQARESAAEAHRAQFEAEDQRNQFLDARFKLRHNAAELSVSSDLAEIDRDLAQEQLNSVLAQLSAASGSSGGPQMTPKDEQNARLLERARTIDLLNSQFQLSQAEVNLLRQTGQLNDWLKVTPATQTNAVDSTVNH